MAGDSTYLEKMGRELKCPICLSLLNSAVSLNCNHVFCNLCIVKSMKSDSSCPVCKIPYRRREVRPAPHMDSLVSIYKSMEMSSGVNMFITQNGSCAKLSDGKLQGEDSVHVKSSFPNKKRVQVPQSQSDGGMSETIVRLSENSSRVPKSDMNDGGVPVLSPFFWLRDEENVDKLSQLSAKSPFHDVPYPDIPEFSDIKDSDDENPSRSIPDGEEVRKSTNMVEMFDSEMFEWTQRACSPELCSSPFKKRVVNSDVTKEKNSKLKDAANDGKKGKRLLTKNVKVMETKQHDKCNISDTGADNPNDQASCKKSKKRGRKTRDTVGTCPMENAGKELDINTDSSGKAQGTFKSRKRNMKVQLSDAATQPKPENGCAADRAGIPNDGNKSLFAESTASIIQKKRRKEDNTSLTSRKGFKKIHSKDLKDLGEASIRKTLQKDTLAQLPASVDPLANIDKSSRSKGKSGQLTGQSKSGDGSQNNKKPKSFRKSASYEIHAGYANSLYNNEDQTTENIQTVDSLTAKKLSSQTNAATLQRCKNSLGKIQCAFCLSSEEFEASGEMVHYYDGRPVGADFNGGSKIIHSHRNCAEWAPNVYFEGDIAINLEAELVRSRRIKCGCCGMKGAALGCYEKSCRKSFHVTCAKLMPQCRWDMDNFVMLCPLHPSYEFPKRLESQARKSKSNEVKQSCAQSNKVAVKQYLDTSPNWSSYGLSKKCVLCCSALTNTERELVSAFEKISGISVSKKWVASVTHVIASTDENEACKRTLKVLMGILDGKWILSIKWIKACIEAMKLVNEESYEITSDTHGIKDGPQRGRLRVQNKLPKLFEGLKFYFMGEFVASYKGYLNDLITAAGGTILHRRPVSGYQTELSSVSSTCETFIVFSLEPPDHRGLESTDAIFDRRRRDAEAVATSSDAKVVSNSWVLNSIAACKVQSLTE